jgi:hypothetical protein
MRERGSRHIHTAEQSNKPVRGRNLFERAALWF